jgi:hypothetical protein
METVFEGLNNAYILFSFLLGLYAAVIAGRNVPISGDFWGAMWINTGLAATILLVALILTAQGLRPVGVDPDHTDQIIYRDVYYLYAIYFVISLPGVFAIMHGGDNRRAALFFAAVALFNSAAAYRAVHWLLTGWE